MATMTTRLCFRTNSIAAEQQFLKQTAYSFQSSRWCGPQCSLGKGFNKGGHISPWLWFKRYSRSRVISIEDRILSWNEGQGEYILSFGNGTVCLLIHSSFWALLICINPLLKTVRILLIRIFSDQNLLVSWIWGQPKVGKHLRLFCASVLLLARKARNTDPDTAPHAPFPTTSQDLHKMRSDKLLKSGYAILTLPFLLEQCPQPTVPPPSTTASTSKEHTLVLGVHFNVNNTADLLPGKNGDSLPASGLSLPLISSLMRVNPNILGSGFTAQGWIGNHFFTHVFIREGMVPVSG